MEKRQVDRCMVCRTINVEGTLIPQGAYDPNQFRHSDGILSVECWRKYCPNVPVRQPERFYNSCKLESVAR